MQGPKKAPLVKALWVFSNGSCMRPSQGTSKTTPWFVEYGARAVEEHMHALIPVCSSVPGAVQASQWALAVSSGNELSQMFMLMPHLWWPDQNPAVLTASKWQQSLSHIKATNKLPATIVIVLQISTYDFIQSFHLSHHQLIHNPGSIIIHHNSPHHYVYSMQGAL